MDSVGLMLHIYRREMANLAVIVGIVKSLTNLTISYQIITKKDATKQSAVGTVSSLSLAILGVRHACLACDQTLVCTHILQIIVDGINLSVHFVYTNNKWRDVLGPLIKGFFMVLAGLGYAQFEDPDTVCNRFGTCLGALSIVTLASPFTKLRQMIRDNECGAINVIITTLSMTASFLWVLVALAANNPTMLFLFRCRTFAACC
ncbi:uncharacterized protein [Onthophagus taurus]|uniref:uncharacterized protein isoform X2 n=1 Tax=Onthophagus taurus TaxID=166361 RepID=UPI000C2035B5|nr:uncharacterized protein LOC111418497 isoform X2 [Onthophagus taurus]